MDDGFLSRRGMVRAIIGSATMGIPLGCSQQTAGRKTLDLPLRTPAVEPTIKVRLLDLPTSILKVGDSSTITRFGGKPFAGPLTISYTKENKGSTWKLLRGSQVLTEQQGGTLDLSSPSDFLINGTQFPTNSLSLRHQEGMIEVVGAFGLETYLPGVLQRELYSQWHPNTYRALAVAARSFALVRMKDRRGKFWHVRASAQDQAFVGGEIRTVATEAVLKTRGQVLTWNNQILCAYYSSCCGGRPARASDRWMSPANAVPPLSGQGRPCPCQKSSRYRWFSEVSGRKLGGEVGLGSIRSIKPIQTNPWGRTVQFQLRDNKGVTKNLPSRTLREKLRAAGADVYSGWVLRCENEAGSLKLTGAGFGHGVGLCQFGSEARAQSGLTWRKILSLGYPGAKIAFNWGP